MCKTWHIIYTCSHAVPFRLSTCRGTHTFQTRKAAGRIASCRSPAEITFKSSSTCGPCAKAEAEHRLVDRISALRAQCSSDDDCWASEFSTAGDGEALEKAETAYQGEVWSLSRQFPDGRFKKMGRPENPWDAKVETKERRKASLLSVEVRPEDVVGHVEERRPAMEFGWADEAHDGLWKLADEIAEDDQDRAEVGLVRSGGRDAWIAGGWSPPEEELDATEGEEDTEPISEPAIVDEEGFAPPQLITMPDDWSSGWSFNSEVECSKPHEQPVSALKVSNDDLSNENELPRTTVPPRKTHRRPLIRRQKDPSKPAATKDFGWYGSGFFPMDLPHGIDDQQVLYVKNK